MSEIGVIGQIYEDRRTKKQGKLVERDEKYKTLLLETSDGKSFNVSFGGFKSNWRSVDEHIETVEEAMQEVDVPIKSEKAEPIVEKPAEEKPVKKPRKEQQLSKGFEDGVLKMIEYANSFGNPNLKASADPKKRRIILKFNNRKVFNVNYRPREDMYHVALRQDLLFLLKDKKYVLGATYHETWVSTKHEFKITPDNLDAFFEDAKPYVVEFMCGNSVREE